MTAAVGAPVWRCAGVRPLMAVSFAAFAGYAGLFTVAPLWVLHGGADRTGSGLVNGVLLVSTVVFQFTVPWAVDRAGFPLVLVVGLICLGAPAPLYALSSALLPVLALSAVRGIGFAVLTVAGASIIARLVPAAQRGSAIGFYGLAVALPMLVLLPASASIAESLGFWVVFVVGALPLAGIAVVPMLGRALAAAPPASGEPTSVTNVVPVRGRLLRVLPPTLVLFSVTLAGGAVLTFLPQMISSTALATIGLFAFNLSAALSRWRAGRLADRYGARRFLPPLLVIATVGLLSVAASLRGHLHGVPVVVALLVTGVAYGAIQNLTLVVALESIGPRDYNLASAGWNIGFDAGTAIGATLLGALATVWSFEGGLVVLAAVVLAALPWSLGRTPRVP